MKTNRFFWIFCLLLAVSCTPKTQPGYTLSGNIAGLSGTVYLTVYEGKLPTRIDSVQAQNGTFAFEGSRALPIFASVDTPEGALVRFFLENRPIAIDGSKDLPARITVAGSPTTDQYNAYRVRMDSITPLLYIDSLARNHRAEDSMMRLVNERKLEFIRSNPKSVAAAYVLYREVSYYLPYEELFGAVKGFDPAVQGSVYLKMVSSMAEALKKTAVGEPFTDISAPDADGRPLALSSVVGPGKYVLLDFWASWCPPCRAEAPVMVGAYRQYNPHGFEIYAVSLDRTREAWLKGIQELGLTWTHVSEVKFWDCPPAEKYGVRAIPSNVLIGPDGKILARNLMGEALEAKLAELIRLPRGERGEREAVQQTAAGN